MQAQAATLLGYTQQELEANCADYIDRLARATGMSGEECLGELRGTAEEALEQIREKEYAAPYRDDRRQVTLVGVSFDADVRNMDRWIIDSDE